jgi:hypothetical protein
LAGRGDAALDLPGKVDEVGFWHLSNLPILAANVGYEG